MEINPMKIIRYTLGHNGEKTTCPNCGHKKRYRRYYDTQLNQYLPDAFGRCDRVNECQYDRSPYADLKFLQDYERGNNTHVEFTPTEPIVIKQQKVVDCTEMFMRCANRERTDALFRYFVAKFGHDIAQKTFDRYCVTCSSDNYTMFWQFSDRMEATTAKCVLYKPNDHHRNRETHPYWTHDRLKKIGFMQEDYQPKKMIFGYHLIRYTEAKKCYIVESEKTALAGFASELAKHKEPSLWLATGGSCNTKLIDYVIAPLILRDISITLIPDADQAGQKWLDYAKSKNIAVSNCVYESATPQQREDGVDLADFLL